MLGPLEDVNGASDRIDSRRGAWILCRGDVRKARIQFLSRVAIVGSCITRDLWPIVGEAPPDDLLYISRTSLPSLLARPLGGLQLLDERPPTLGPFSYRSMLADLQKTALGRLVAHRPTHIIFDFIDERVNLLATGDTVVTHSWELAESGYMTQPPFADAHVIERTSQGCELLWRMALHELSALIATTPLASATVILHEGRWSSQFYDEAGELQEFGPDSELFGGRRAEIAEHNALLARYEAAFRQAFPSARTIAAPSDLRIADARHRWGLSPFHYAPDYYRSVLQQLQALGI
jgi:hypothetical protein